MPHNPQRVHETDAPIHRLPIPVDMCHDAGFFRYASSEDYRLREETCIPSLLALVPEEARHELETETPEQATATKGCLWSRHPDGFALYVPRSAERFFRLIEPALRRDIFLFLGVRTPTCEAFSRLTLPELRDLAAWLDSVRERTAGWEDAGPDEMPILPGWAENRAKEVEHEIARRTAQEAADALPPGDHSKDSRFSAYEGLRVAR